MKPCLFLSEIQKELLKYNFFLHYTSLEKRKRRKRISEEKKWRKDLPSRSSSFIKTCRKRKSFCVWIVQSIIHKICNLTLPPSISSVLKIGKKKSRFSAVSVSAAPPENDRILKGKETLFLFSPL